MGVAIPSRSADFPVKVDTRFQNVDQVIGWVRAKGSCNTTLLVKGCSVAVELSNKNQAGEERFPGWLLSGSLATVTIKDKEIGILIFINRTRRFSLSDKDKKAFVWVHKQTRYEVSSMNGKIANAFATIEVMNYKEEKFLDFEIPLRSPYLFGGLSSEELGKNVSLFREGFGLEWVIIP